MATPSWTYNPAAPAVTFQQINDNVLAQAQTAEGNLKTQIDNLGTKTPTTLDLLVLQQQMQQWSMLVELESTIAKTTADTMKGVIQKSS